MSYADFGEAGKGSFFSIPKRLVQIGEHRLRGIGAVRDALQALCNLRRDQRDGFSSIEMLLI